MSNQDTSGHLLISYFVIITATTIIYVAMVNSVPDGLRLQSGFLLGVGLGLTLDIVHGKLGQITD